MSKAERDLVASAQKAAAEAFKSHVLTVEGDRRWLFKKPGESFYAFRVVSGPFLVALWGDVGDLLISPRSAQDGVAWLRGAFNGCSGGEHDYVLGKVPEPLQQKMLLRPRLVEEIEEILNQLAEDRAESGPSPKLSKREEQFRKFVQDLRDGLDEHWSDQELTTFFYEEHPDPCELPDLTYWDYQSLFQVEALRHFCLALDAFDRASALRTSEVST